MGEILQILGIYEKAEFILLTNNNDKLYDLPYAPIKPFKPYNLKNLKRFIYCASYYLPIKPINNFYLLNDKLCKKYKIKEVNPNNLYKLTDEFVKNNKITEPYWLNVNMFYDVSSNLDYIVLKYKNPYNKNINKSPIVRFHSESLFDRFPLKETLYKNILT